jgi:hypothetical protein
MRTRDEQTCGKCEPHVDKNPGASPRLRLRFALSDPYLGPFWTRSTRSVVNGLDPRDLLALARAVCARSDSEVRRSFVLHAPHVTLVPIRDMTTVRIPRID